MRVGSRVVHPTRVRIRPAPTSAADDRCSRGRRSPPARPRPPVAGGPRAGTARGRRNGSTARRSRTRRRLGLTVRGGPGSPVPGGESWAWMPELPDVEGYRRYFARFAARKTVRAVEVPAPDILRNTTPQALGRALRNRRFRSPVRHGKWLFAPTGGSVVLMHFGMTGRLAWNPDAHPHDRLLFHFAQGTLAYQAAAGGHRERALGRAPVGGASGASAAGRRARARRDRSALPSQQEGPCRVDATWPDSATPEAGSPRSAASRTRAVRAAGGD